MYRRMQCHVCHEKTSEVCLRSDMEISKVTYVFVFFVSLLDLEKSVTFKNRFAQLFGAAAGVAVFIFITGHVPR